MIKELLNELMDDEPRFIAVMVIITAIVSAAAVALFLVGAF